MEATKYETVTMVDISKPTREFLDYHKSLVIPESYSNLHNDYGSIHNDYGSIHDSNTYGMTDKYFSHDDFNDFLMHHGTKGQKWGHRQYQNKDGSLTPLGRVHYGVGAARKAVGKGASAVGKGMAKGASAIGKAIRKKNNKQTDAELDAELDRAKVNYERKKKRELIDALNGKKKKVSDMTDQEVIDMINRYKNEKQLKNLKKDANKSRARLYIEEAARKGLASAVENTTRNLLSNIGQGVVDSADTEYNKSKRAKETSENRLKEYENKEKLNKLKKGEKDASEELKKQAQDAENAKKLLTNKLELEALQGDPFAAKHIHDVAVARKGKRYSENSEEARREKEEVQKIGKDFLNSTVYAKERKSAPLSLPASGETSSSKSKTKSRTSSKSETNTNSSKKKKKKKRSQQDDDQ